jgi:tripartite-type tricarboxylate transporter receptor subunit TctC
MKSHQPTRRELLRAGAAVAALGAGAVRAQSWPNKPVTLVVPFPAGGGTDAFARPLTAVLSKNLGRQVIIDNKGGAGGPDYKVSTWYGIWAPKATPKEAVDRFQAEMKKAFAADEIKATWNGMGAEVPNLFGDEFGRFVSSEIKRWAEVVKASGAKLD